MPQPKKQPTKRTALDLLATSSESSFDDTSEDSDQERYDVEAIRAWRYNRRTKTKEFLIKWLGYPESDNTWEPMEHLSCRKPLRKFEDSLSKRERLLYETKNLEDLDGLQRNAEIKSIRVILPEDSLFLSSSSGESKLKKMKKSSSKFVLMMVFEDSETDLEEVELKSFFKYRPDEAFRFVEGRLVDEDSLEANPVILN